MKVPASDLAAAVDALLENVFAHTAEGVPFDVVIVKSDNGHGGASLIVADRGEGFPDASTVLHRGTSGAGSTGLGMDIVRRTAEASGGRVVVENSPVGGAA